jgi:hypothetical protein
METDSGAGAWKEGKEGSLPKFTRSLAPPSQRVLASLSSCHCQRNGLQIMGMQCCLPLPAGSC